MVTKTLGGDRLGAGKKMKVAMHGYERSTHDIGFIWRSTGSAGTLIPFMSEVALPGDTFDINLECDIKTHPTIGPLFGSYKVQLDIFQAPMRLYNSLLHNNALNIGRNMAQVKLPLLVLNATNVDGVVENGGDLNTSQINPSSILAYLGIMGVGMCPDTGGPFIRYMNAIPFLAYWEIYKNYYANKQEEEGAVIHTEIDALVDTVDQISIDGTALIQAPAIGLAEMINGSRFLIEYTGTSPIPAQIFIRTQYNGDQPLNVLARFLSDNGAGQAEYEYNFSRFGVDYAQNWRYREKSDIQIVPPRVVRFNLDNIDEVRQEILAFPGTTPYFVTDGTQTPYQYVLRWTEELGLNALSSQEGLAVKTYQSDLFNNWLSTEWIDGPGGISEITAISTVGDSFTIDTLNLSKKVYDMLNRIAVSGGTYDDWLDVVYDHDRYQRAESPIYHGGLIKELVFQEVVSNSAAENAGQPLGTLAGKGIMASKHKGGKIVINVDEPSYIMGIFSLTPRVDYSQGNKWDTGLLTLDDLHKPALDEIGFQELIKEQMAWWDTRYAGGEWNQFSAGKQPAWMNYMTNVNVVKGNFAIANNEMFMTLNRRYDYDPGEGIFDMTTYIDPAKFNFIFAETALDAQNFWIQIAADITARRKMSGKLMPNL